jgi:hypothetical protein
MPGKRKQQKLDDKEQSARFIEAARQVQSDNAKVAFDEAMSKIAKKKHKK